MQEPGKKQTNWGDLLICSLNLLEHAQFINSFKKNNEQTWHHIQLNQAKTKFVILSKSFARFLLFVLSIYEIVCTIYYFVPLFYANYALVCLQLVVLPVPVLYNIK